MRLTRAPSAFAISWPPRQWPITGVPSEIASRSRPSSGATHGRSSLTLIGPPIMPMPANAAGSAGTAAPSSSAISVHGDRPARSSHSPKRPGVSVGEKRKMATGRMSSEAPGPRTCAARSDSSSRGVPRAAGRPSGRRRAARDAAPARRRRMRRALHLLEQVRELARDRAASPGAFLSSTNWRSASSRSTPDTASRLTIVPRCTCQNFSGSSSASSSFNGVRISASPAASTTRVYLVSDWK